MKKCIFYFFAVTAIVLSGCTAARNLSYSNPPVIFAYPNSTPIIKDQSKVATIITRGELSIEGIDLSTMRVSNNNKNKTSVVVDVLPGTYSIIKQYTESVGSQQTIGNRRVETYKITPFTATVELEAGHVYWVTTSKNGIFIEKDNLTDEHFFTGIVSDKSFPNYLKQQIIESRNNAR